MVVLWLLGVLLTSRTPLGLHPFAVVQLMRLVPSFTLRLVTIPTNGVSLRVPYLQARVRSGAVEMAT